MWDAIYPYLAAILLVIAYVVFKTIFEADRRERKAVAEWETSHDGTQIGSSEDETRPTS